MSPHTAHAVNEAHADGALARVDAQDESLAAPIREFLSSQGCVVTSREQAGVTPQYHIMVGSSDFVKEILFSLRESTEKRIAIVWDSIPDIGPVATRTRTKIVRVDARPFTTADVESFFTFFFTSREMLLDVRVHRDEPVVEPLPRVLSSGDEERVGGLIREIFDVAPVEEKPKRRTAHRVPLVVGLIAGIFCMVLFPLVWFAAGIGISAGLLGYSASQWKAGKTDRAVWLATAGFYWVKQAEWALGIVSLPARTAGLGDAVRGPERLVSFLSDVGLGLGRLKDVADDAKLAASTLLRADAAGAGESAAVAIGRLRTSVGAVQNHFSLASAQLGILLRDRTFPFSVNSLYSLGEKGEKAIRGGRKNLSFAEQLLALYPLVGGFRTKQVYLILLQNSMELRPGGGFIGSIMQVTVEDGKMIEMNLQDVYAIDGQLKGHVDPPVGVKELLAQEHWYLRDSNWDPDFRVSGERARWFYEKETGVAVDGVIAVSLPFLTDLLSVTGPLTLSDYDDRITADNFFGKAVFYTQSEFFPGSTQKKDFLGSVTSALFEVLMRDRKVSTPLLFRAAASALERRNLQFYFGGSETERLVERFGWAGSVFAQEGCLSVPTCVFDPLLVSEANVSVNKANAFVTRARTRTVEFKEDGSFVETLLITWRNPSGGPPRDAGGSYRAYMQLVVPQDAVGFDVLVDGKPAGIRTSKNRSAPVPYWESLSRDDRNSIAVAVDIPAGGQAQLSVSYRRGTLLAWDSQVAWYELTEQKQAGAADEPWQLVIRYPIFWQADASGGNGTVPQESFLAKEAQLTYNSTLSADQDIRIRFVK
ncbi:DUF4012 domain-containing protein [Candidatus Gottesmanbacteria bacterium]|nr:DUF4012 domain-containing protein [Candidatus Gottesmanbacteria bacterium]